MNIRQQIPRLLQCLQLPFVLRREDVLVSTAQAYHNPLHNTADDVVVEALRNSLCALGDVEKIVRGNHSSLPNNVGSFGVISA